MTDERNALEVSELTKTFGKFNAVKNLNLSIRKGEYMGLLGPNGAGKSTTLKCISGMLKPTAGRILINGIDSAQHHRDSLAHVGCVIEIPDYYPEFTPADVLDYVGKLCGVRGAELRIRARDVLEEVRLWDWRNVPISRFSKGMKQRLSLAQAILPNPSLIILDELTSGLDPRGMIEVREVLRNLNNGERSLLFSTHILKEVSDICHSVTVINHGRVITSGDVRTLIRESVRKEGKEFTLRLRTLKRISDEFLADLKGCIGVIDIEYVNPFMADIIFNGDENDQVAISDLVSEHGLGLLSITEFGTDLESLYMDLTHERRVNVR